MKQYIVIRKDLPMSPGKLAAQVSHASMAFITKMIAENIKEAEDCYESKVKIGKNMWNTWMSPEASFTKVILGTKNRDQMLKLIDKANIYGLQEGIDFFCIRDEARTDLQGYREEDGRVLTCIGFRPREDCELKELLGKLQLYR